MTASNPAMPFAPTGLAPVPSRAAASEAAAIDLRGLSRSFGDKQVLRQVDLHVPAGQFLAIVGRSGCGKSTLLRILLGLDAPTSGAVAVGDGRRAGLSRIMFQEPRLLPWARALDNVRVGAPRGEGKAAGRAAAQAALEQVGLGDRAGEWPSVLSGGQKQRVALARALVSRPSLLALDEPLGALDALTRIEMQNLLESVWRRQRFTAVLVTHDVSEALALADRVILIEEGRLALDLAVSLPRPRRRGSPEMARLEGEILDRLFGKPARVERVAAGAPQEAVA